jgi:hypothetical protein
LSSFPFPEFHRVVYLLDRSSTYERKHVPTYSCWLTLLNVLSSNCINLPSKHMLSLFLLAE